MPAVRFWTQAQILTRERACTLFLNRPQDLHGFVFTFKGGLLWRYFRTVVKKKDDKGIWNKVKWDSHPRQGDNCKRKAMQGRVRWTGHSVGRPGEHREASWLFSFLILNLKILPFVCIPVHEYLYHVWVPLPVLCIPTPCNQSLQCIPSQMHSLLAHGASGFCWWCLYLNTLSDS